MSLKHDITDLPSHVVLIKESYRRPICKSSFQRTPSSTKQTVPGTDKKTITIPRRAALEIITTVRKLKGHRLVNLETSVVAANELGDDQVRVGVDSFMTAPHEGS